MASVCRAAIHFCRLRVTRLDALGNPAAGPNNVYVSDKPISLGVTPVVSEGEAKEVVGGCDCIIVSYRGKDKLMRFDLELALAMMEPALVEMMTGATAIVQGGQVSGVWFAGQNSCSAAQQPNVAIEAWQDSWEDDHQGGSPFQYVRWLFPSASFQIGDVTLENEFAQPGLTGFSRSNPNWNTGIFGDQPEAIPDSSPGGWWFDDTNPTAFCDYQTEGLT